MNYLPLYPTAVLAAVMVLQAVTMEPPELLPPIFYDEVGDPTPIEFQVADSSVAENQAPHEKAPEPLPPLEIPDNEWYHGMAKFGPKIARRWMPVIEESLQKNGSDRPPILIASMSLVESSGDRYAVSDKDAQGLAGLRLSACAAVKRLDCDRFDPHQSFEIADLYLEHIENSGFDTLEKQLFAYNQGPPTAKAKLRKGKNPMDHEYIKKVLFVQEVLMRASLS